MRTWVPVIWLFLAIACAPVPPRNVVDSLPQLRTELIPFRYPLELYERGIEGDVTLRLHVDSVGAVVAESTRVAESSGKPQLDAAAIEGAPALLFRPAMLNGRPVALTVLFPVKFRVPADGRTPADTHSSVPGR
ncbi:MAG TPA: energy transducer TonB [Gemmatimonadaceae bacterium]|nr:energy transducer TonB [Gemmatimonadaceae bacterium]